MEFQHLIQLHQQVEDLVEVDQLIRVAKRERGWAWVDQAHKECMLQDRRHAQHSVYTEAVRNIWAAQTALWEAEQRRLELRVASLQRKLRRVRRR